MRTKRKRHVLPCVWVLGAEIASGITRAGPGASNESEAMKESQPSPKQGCQDHRRTDNMSLESHLPDSEGLLTWACCSLSLVHSIASLIALRAKSDGVRWEAALRKVSEVHLGHEHLCISVNGPFSFADGVLEGVPECSLLSPRPCTELRCYVCGGASSGGGVAGCHCLVHHLEVPAAESHPSSPLICSKPVPSQSRRAQPAPGHGVQGHCA